MPDLVINLESSAVSELAKKAAELLIRSLKEKAGIAAKLSASNAGLTLALDSGLGKDAYSISEASGGIRICGGNDAGLLYGVGKFIHSALSGDGSYAPQAWLGKSAPSCAMRGMYFAHNFRNWYRSAQLGDIKRYIEELALWGMNHLVLPLGTNPVSPIAEIEKEVVPRQIELMKFARGLGIKVGVITIANGILDVPTPDIAVTPVPDAAPPKRGNVGNRVCPSNPKGFAAIRAHYEHLLELYNGVELDFFVPFPYDEGGCGCPDCSPWGARGYVKACKELSRLAKAKFPNSKMIACTWAFDVLKEPEGEYEGLNHAILQDRTWCDAVMCDAHGEYPAWPIKNGPIGGLPMINFSEISMWGRWPWGGYGANAFPARMVNIWNQSKHLLSGGLPYSEGRFDDINKIACLSLFWNRDANARSITIEYAAHEFSRTAATKIADAIAILEEIYDHDNDPAYLPKAASALDLLEDAEKDMSGETRNSWRWRMLKLRAIIDVESSKHIKEKRPVSIVQKQAFEELIKLYCAENALVAVRPPL